MKILTVHPGAEFSVADCYDGLTAALRDLGAECIPFRLDERLAKSHRYLDWQWKRFGKRKPEWKPSAIDTLYLAGQGVLEMALRRRVDWVLIFSAMYLHPDWLILLRRAGLKTAVLLTESPYQDEGQAGIAPLVSALWTNERVSVPFLARYNPNVRYLQHGWSPMASVPEVLPSEPVPAHDVVFVGTGFQERIEVLSAVDWSGIDFGLYGTWELLPSRHHLRRHLRGWLVPNARTQALYRAAKVGINLHRSSVVLDRRSPRIAHAESLNPRAYELAAAGVPHVSDYRAELPEVFGDAVPTFTTPSELGAAVRRLLSDEAARQYLSRVLPARAAPHTHAARAAQMLADLHDWSAAASRHLAAV